VPDPGLESVKEVLDRPRLRDGHERHGVFRAAGPPGGRRDPAPNLGDTCCDLRGPIHGLRVRSSSARFASLSASLFSARGTWTTESFRIRLALARASSR